MRILGIDPALATLGWGIIKDNSPKIIYINSGVIKSSASELIYKRLGNIVQELTQIINDNKPDAICMEETFINKNAASSLKLGYVRGAIMAMVGIYDLPFYEFKPNAIKKAVVGVGHAEKEQVKHMVKLIVSNTPDLPYFDQYDALAAAYTCSVHYNNKY